MRRIVFIFFLGLILFPACQPKQPATPVAVTQEVPKEFLDSLSKRTFFYFWDLASPEIAQIPDRWPTKSFSSIAATGFGLTSYIIGVERGYVTREQAAERTLKTIKFFIDAPKGDGTTNVTGFRGFFYHFIDMQTGIRFQQVELSTVDTGLLMAGMLTSQVYFDRDNETEKQIRQYVDTLYKAIEWDWAMNKGKTLSMGWHPEKGFIDSRWNGYNEGMILYIMALGSPTHTIPAESWKAWTETYPYSTYMGQQHINFGPLFGHQYSHMYIDFRDIYDPYMKEKGFDYFENSKRATYANREYCIKNKGGFIGYSDKIWGLTACDGPSNSIDIKQQAPFMGYSARGAAEGYEVDDGTISPTAAGGSIAFAPEICIPALEEMYRLYGDKIYDQYGFKDAFNWTAENKDGSKGWVDVDYLGIDQGPIVIQIENYKSGLVWELMKKSPYIKNGLKKAGFTGGWLDK